MKEFIIPERRYAMFTDLIGGNYLLAVKGKDILTAPKWGGFVKWIGGIKKEERRKVAENSYDPHKLFNWID